MSKNKILETMIKRIMNEEVNLVGSKLEKFKTIILKKVPELKFLGYENKIGTLTDPRPSENVYRLCFCLKSNTHDIICVHKSFTAIAVYSQTLGIGWTDVSCQDTKECLDIFRKIIILFQKNRRVRSGAEFKRLVSLDYMNIE